jgi:hypothetical protein
MPANDARGPKPAKGPDELKMARDDEHLKRFKKAERALELLAAGLYDDEDRGEVGKRTSREVDAAAKALADAKANYMARLRPRYSGALRRILARRRARGS